MNEEKKRRLLEKNSKLINMVIERAKTEFPEDIAIIGLTGSFSTGDYHEKSDLDLIIINNTPRGWDISFCFILGDVGYDIYCTPWETRIQAQSNLESPMVSCLVDLQILYCAKPEYLERFNAYRQKALDELAKPIGKDCIQRAKKNIDDAKQQYAAAMIADNIGAVRAAAGGVAYYLVNAVVSLNNTRVKRGIKRYMEELRTYRYLPEGFEDRYMAVVRATTIGELQDASRELLSSVVKLYDAMHVALVDKPVPTYDNMAGTYEELWCNCRNKVIRSCDTKDAAFAFQAALSAQNAFDEMAEMFGTQRFELLQYFDADNLQPFKEAFLRAMDAYLLEYEKVGRKVERFDTFEQLYAKYMQR